MLFLACHLHNSNIACKCLELQTNFYQSNVCGSFSTIKIHVRAAVYFWVVAAVYFWAVAAFHSVTYKKIQRNVC